MSNRFQSVEKTDMTTHSDHIYNPLNYPQWAAQAGVSCTSYDCKPQTLITCNLENHQALLVRCEHENIQYSSRIQKTFHAPPTVEFAIPYSLRYSLILLS